MKIVVLTRKFLLELWREPLNLGLIFGFPIVLLGFYYLAFGGNQSLASFLNLLVINEDQGAWGELLVGEIETAVYENEPLFTITHISDRQAAETRLRERKAALLLEIPSDFSEKVEFNSTNNSAISHATDVQPVTLHLVGDTNSDSFIFAQSLLEGQLRQFVNGGAGQETAVPITYTFLPGTGTMSDFDFGVSGIIVFGLSLLVVT
ncbi:MAG: ABC transporter permease, partial [Chloroflexi bacterium]|nr:ABC transporter permease [Chloroflexota bacterium]